MSFKVCVNAVSLFGKYHLRDIFVFPLGCLLLQLPLEAVWRGVGVGWGGVGGSSRSIGREEGSENCAGDPKLRLV